MTTSRLSRLLTTCSACWILAALLAGPARAQEVDWRQDYSRACQEAKEKGRLIVIDVGIDPSRCYYCKLLDQRTFKDPAVASLLNDRCIPLKLDAEAHSALAEQLRVSKYPTLIFASHDGKVLGYQEGFIEPAALQERLQRLLPSTNPAPSAVSASPTLASSVAGTDWMARDLQEATRAVGAADYVRAVTLLKRIVDDGKDRPGKPVEPTPLQAQARGMLQELEQQAAGRCAEARQMVEKGQVTQAVETVTELVRVYAGTKAAREGGRLLVTLASRVEPSESPRIRVARELLGQAREDYQRKQYLSCLDHCEDLMANFADLPEGSEASKLAAEIKKDPECTKQACDQMGERLSLLYLSLADTWLKKGQPQQAVFYLERIVQSFPNSRHAEMAQVRLAQIHGQPNRPAEYKK
jgi:thioredoxin-related protein